MALSPSDLPHHVAIIMDGNGRWARQRGLPRVLGHQEGARAVQRVVTAARERDIRVLTLFAFSSQNWLRPRPEVQALMLLLAEYVKLERRRILDNGIRLVAVGNLSDIPEAPRKALQSLIDDSRDNSAMTLCLALSYGGREEIVAAARDIALRAARGEIDPHAVDEALFEQTLWSDFLGPVDLLIRTSGEQRISNFLLWSLAYTELYFTDRYWPDFDGNCLDEALSSFSRRERRFGKVG
jgi:undecaprenyl diphosphate synthase